MSTSPSRNEPRNSKSQSRRPVRTIAIRLKDWSEWSRQIARGVQHFAHDHPRLRLYVEAGETSGARVFGKRLQIDGLITGLSSDIKAWKKVLRPSGTQIVVFTAAFPRGEKTVARVRVDDTKVARTIGRHFLSGGFRRLAYWGSLDKQVDDGRLKGLMDFVAETGCPFEIFKPTRMANKDDKRTASRWVAALTKPVGIAAWNMDIARRIVEACERVGISVPEQVGVVAWDDDPMLAETLEPTISANVLPAEKLGYEAASLLDRLMNGQPQPQSPIVIEPSGILHIRESSDTSALENRDMHMAVQYIREHACEGIKASQIANALRISRRKLDYEFPRVFGRTVHDAIVQIRLDRAKQLLLETHWNLHRVAEHCGMGTKQTLCRIFHEHDHMTPAQYRQRFGVA